jgi:hypothetical protein
MDTDAELLAMKPPSRVPVVVAASLGLLLGAAAGAGATLVLAPKPKAPYAREHAAAPSAQASASAVASVSATPPASAAAKAPPADSPRGRVTGGDPDAIKALEAKPADQRSLEEATDLARGRAAAKSREIAELKRKLTLLPKFAEEKATEKRMRELANDREVATEMLVMLAALPGPLGPDQLYSVMARNTSKEESQKFAEELLATKEVRKNATAALSVAFDLRRVTDCEQAKKLLEQVKLAGDRRSIMPLARLQEKRGCGKRELEDCWKCLRDGNLLRDALAEARKRSVAE